MISLYSNKAKKLNFYLHSSCETLLSNWVDNLKVIKKALPDKLGNPESLKK